MRVLCVLALLLLASAAYAQNPDGPQGTIWFEPFYSTTFKGDWDTPDYEGTLKIQDAGLQIGAVSTGSTTLLVGLSKIWSESHGNNVLPYEDSAFVLSFRFRLYILGND